VIVGSGSPAAARAFAAQVGLEGVRFFTDEHRLAFERAGFRRGLGTLLSPRAIGNYVRAFFSGHRGGRKEGDALQQGGALVVAPDGTLLYKYVSRASGDHPDIRDLLTALRSKSFPGEKISGP
jgi:hypothetical protein